MNVENEWCDGIDASKLEGAVRRTEVEEAQYAMNCMKIGNASGPSGVAIELFKAGGRHYSRAIWRSFIDFGRS